jgi:thymidine kinase
MLDASNNYKVIAIDEVMFFGEELLKTIDIFRKKGKMILASGLDLDFKAEPFGIMPKILAFADDVIKTHGTCEYKGCSDLANRTQRLINNEPAHYNEPLISIEGSENFESYECRCLDHHYIPGKP